MISEFVEYVKQAWKNKPNVSSPLNADRLNHMESGIENNSKKIKETVTEVNELTEKISRIVTFEQQDSPVTLQFSGNVQTRKINAILLLSSQGMAIPPIAVGFGGSGGYENIEKNTAYVSSGLDGISIGASNGRITIPTFGGNWGTFSVVLLSNRLSVSQV